MQSKRHEARGLTVRSNCALYTEQVLHPPWECDMLPQWLLSLDTLYWLLGSE